MDKKRSNILLITSDQQQGDTLGKTNPILKTPNLDRLADEGILFERAYACNAEFMQKVFWHDKYKIVFYSDTSMMGELYDLENDPDQYVNLWNEPSAQKIKNELALKFIAYEMSKDGVLRPRPAPA